MKKIITVDGKEFTLRASGLTPLLYHNEFGDDFMNDLASLTTSYEESGSFAPDLLIKAGKIAYVLNKQGDPEQPNTFEEWLDQFETFSIIEAFPQIMELLALNNKSTSTPKKETAL